MIPDALAARYRRDGYWRDETLSARLERTCTQRAGAIAFIDGDERLRFEQLAECVDRLAPWFAQLTKPGDVVSWVLPNWWEAAVIHHAAVRAGCISNPLNPAWRERELAAVLDEVRPAVLAVPEEWREFQHLEFAVQMQADLSIPAVLAVRTMPRLGVFDLSQLLTLPGGSLPQPTWDASSPAVLLYTSGTTSAPKGVVHTHQGLLCEMETFRTLHRLTPEDRYLGGSPINHIAGLVYGVMTPGALGTSTVLLDRWEPARALRAIETERATFQTGPPTFLQTLAGGAGSTDLRSFRLFSTGGAAIVTEKAKQAAARLGCVLKRAYGSTEIPTLTATTLDDDERARTETDGRASAGAEIRIVDTDGSDTSEGEIWGRAPEMFVGYRNPVLNDALEDDGWFRTGDIGTLDADGLLRVTGRLKDIIIRGGENISATELEDLLALHPAVADVAVVGVPDERLGERVCAVVVVRDGARFTLPDMIDHLRARSIATHKLPELLELRGSLPKTESGKVAKAELRAQLLKSG